MTQQTRDADVQIVVTRSLGKAALVALTPLGQVWLIQTTGRTDPLYVEEEQLKGIEHDLRQLDLGIRKIVD